MIDIPVYSVGRRANDSLSWIVACGLVRYKSGWLLLLHRLMVPAKYYYPRKCK